jgi:hypothetical protein
VVKRAQGSRLPVMFEYQEEEKGKKPVNAVTVFEASVDEPKDEKKWL